MKLLTAVALAAAALAFPASARDPLTLTVHPSGVDPVSAEARAREERLRRRMEEADFHLRNICIRCGGIDRPESAAPFRPIDALGARQR
jgi:hypothetical protein